MPVRGAAKCPCYLRASSPVGQREFALAPQSHLFRLCSHSPSSFPRHEVPHSICAPRRPAEASSIPPGPLFPVFRTAPGPPSGRKGGEGSFFGNSEPTSGHLPPRDGAQPRRTRRAPQGLVAQRPRFQRMTTAFPTRTSVTPMRPPKPRPPQSAAIGCQCTGRTGWPPCTISASCAP